MKGTLQWGALLLVPMLAGCFGSNGGSGNLTGKSALATSLELVSANVVDGTLRDVTVHNKATQPIPAGAWTFHLTGTSGGKATSHDSTVNAAALAPGEARAISLADSSQPDWQDGTDLTILATGPGGAKGDLTIRTV
jgi:hypothetical protein